MTFLWSVRYGTDLAAYPDLLGQGGPADCSARDPYSALLLVGLAMRALLPAPGGLLPHRFTLSHPGMGGLFSVALSLGLPPPGVYPAPSPHGVRTFLDRSPAAVIQPSARRPYGTRRGGRQGAAVPRSRATVRRSSAVSGPAAQGRWRRRNASRRAGTSGLAQGGQALRQHRIRVGRRRGAGECRQTLGRQGSSSQSAGRGRSCGPAPGRNGRSRRRARWTSGP